MGVTASAIGVVPSGRFENSAGNGIGGLGGLLFMGDGLGGSVRSGYIQFLSRGDYELSLIPILGGILLSTEDGGVYITGEMGAVITRADYSSNALTGSDKNSTHPGWTVGVGSMPGPLDLRFAFHVWDARNMKQNMSMALSLGIVLR